MAIIEVEHVTKEYRLGAMQSLKTIAGRMIGRNPPDSNNFKALNDVSFSIEKGEVVGIIGHNGAGKSTLLKMLCRITTPTSGSLKVQGRVAPLIEVGAGLVGEMTGRENIYLNATILGMTRKEIDTKVNEIIEFSELDKFIDTPVKRYSSGMQVRLGFAIATAINCEILIVDEVLAVGDVAFQRKCIDKMEEYKNDPTKTLIIVGHNIRQLERICSRLLILEGGRLVMDGDPSPVSKRYYTNTTKMIGNLQNIIKSHQGDNEIEINSLSILKSDAVDVPINTIMVWDSYKIKLDITSALEVVDCEINIGIHSPELVFVEKTSTRMVGKSLNIKKGISVVEFTFDQMRLAPGPYSLGIGIYDRMRRPIFTSTSLLWFTVELRDDDFVNFPQSCLSYGKADWVLN